VSNRRRHNDDQYMIHRRMTETNSLTETYMETFSHLGFKFMSIAN